MSETTTKFDNPITDYWFAHYVSETGHCSLCGNHGVIDTTDSPNGYTPAGLSVGRRNYCICPNGQALRMQAHGQQ
jgi:hypothetical protein